MWQVQFANANDFLKLAKLPPKALEDLQKYFDEVTKTFDNLNSSVFCTSGIYKIEEHNPSAKHTIVNHHIDSEERIIRITSVE